MFPLLVHQNKFLASSFWLHIFLAMLFLCCNHNHMPFSLPSVFFPHFCSLYLIEMLHLLSPLTNLQTQRRCYAFRGGKYLLPFKFPPELISQNDLEKLFPKYAKGRERQRPTQDSMAAATTLLAVPHANHTWTSPDGAPVIAVRRCSLLSSLIKPTVNKLESSRL